MQLHQQDAQRKDMYIEQMDDLRWIMLKKAKRVSCQYEAWLGRSLHHTGVLVQPQGVRVWLPNMGLHSHICNM